MNELIKHLAKQAGAVPAKQITNVPGDLVLIGEEEIQAFAELIVRECAKKCNEFGDRLEDERPNTMLGDIAWECADGIKRMFGIEE